MCWGVGGRWGRGHQGTVVSLYCSFLLFFLCSSVCFFTWTAGNVLLWHLEHLFFLLLCPWCSLSCFLLSFPPLTVQHFSFLKNTCPKALWTFWRGSAVPFCRSTGGGSGTSCVHHSFVGLFPQRWPLQHPLAAPTGSTHRQHPGTCTGVQSCLLENDVEGASSFTEREAA